jgi:tRNA C32,U32 (ribose-2'-O)-methylase TrmJ
MDKLRRMFVRSSLTESEASLLRGSLEALMKNYGKNNNNK